MRKHKPCWHQLWWLALLMSGALWLDASLVHSPLGHQLVEVGIVLFTYGTLAYWLWVSQAAVAHEADAVGTEQQIDPTGSPVMGVTSVSTGVGQATAKSTRLAAPLLQNVIVQRMRPGSLMPGAPPSGARLN